MKTSVFLLIVYLLTLLWAGSKACPRAKARVADRLGVRDLAPRPLLLLSRIFALPLLVDFSLQIFLPQLPLPAAALIPLLAASAALHAFLYTLGMTAYDIRRGKGA